MTELDRRTVLRGAGAVGVAAVGVPLIAGCGSGSGSGGDAGSPSTPVTVATSAVAVHGGVIQDRVVVTQPAEGTFKAFSAICPHQGCTVGTVSADVITCPCHGSTFSAADGSHLSGPAPKGLTPKTATVTGTNVVVT